MCIPFIQVNSAYWRKAADWIILVMNMLYNFFQYQRWENIFASLNTIQNGWVRNLSSVYLTVICRKVNESPSAKYTTIFFVLIYMRCQLFSKHMGIPPVFGEVRVAHPFCFLCGAKMSVPIPKISILIQWQTSRFLC